MDRKELTSVVLLIIPYVLVLAKILWVEHKVSRLEWRLGWGDAKKTSQFFKRYERDNEDIKYLLEEMGKLKDLTKKKR